MCNTVRIQLFGKEYDVPADMTIMRAMEHVGYKTHHVKGCGNGFCGACAVLYRIKSEGGAKGALACRTLVREGMCVSEFPGIPMPKIGNDIDGIEDPDSIAPRLYPELDHCIKCARCTKVCPQGIDVMKYIGHAKRGETTECAELSFECVMCGLCAKVCPQNIPQPQIAMLARRIKARYLTPVSSQLEDRTKRIDDGEFDNQLEDMLNMSNDVLIKLYNSRDLE